MSYELYDKKVYLGSLATNKGLADMSDFAETNSLYSLDTFFEEGTSKKLESLRSDVKEAIKLLHESKNKQAPTLLASFNNLLALLNKAVDTVEIVS